MYVVFRVTTPFCDEFATTSSEIMNLGVYRIIVLSRMVKS